MQVLSLQALLHIFTYIQMHKHTQKQQLLSLRSCAQSDASYIMRPTCTTRHLTPLLSRSLTHFLSLSLFLYFTHKHLWHTHSHATCVHVLVGFWLHTYTYILAEKEEEKWKYKKLTLYVCVCMKCNTKNLCLKIEKKNNNKYNKKE